jgi:hypothetical protein
MIQARKIGGGDIAGENIVTGLLEPFDDGATADQADLAFGAGTTI